ncbi:UNVERIFIED_ORG: hypothetical protein E4P37_11955 [Bacillus sp. AZ43]
MTHPSQPTDALPRTGPPAHTQEMPAVPPPPATPAGDQHDAAAFVPGLAAPPAAPSSRRWSYGPRLRAIALGVTLVLLALVFLTWGLAVGREPLWSAATLWSVFAFACTAWILLAFVPDAPGRSRLRPRFGWRAALGGLAGLAVFWLLVALPQAATNRGFLLTAAFAAAIAAVWTSPNRPVAGRD